MDDRRLKEKLIGRIRYPHHVSSKNQLFIKVISISESSARILNIDIPELPENIHILTAKDIPGRNWLNFGQGGMPLLAEKQVRYPHEPIALLVGQDPEELNRYHPLINIETEALPLIPEPSLTDDQYCSYSREFFDGNPEEIFQDNKVLLLEDYYEMLSQHHPVFPSANSSCQKDGAKYLIHSISQWPDMIQRNVSSLLKIKKENVIMKPYSIENHQDSKLLEPMISAAMAALVCHTFKCTSTLIMQPEDLHLKPFPSGKTGIYIKAALSPEGDLLAFKMDFTQEMGAWPLWDKEKIDRMCFSALGGYHCRNVEILGKAFVSNHPPSGWFSDGLCSPIFTALELFSYNLADLSKLTPWEWKNRNSLRKGNGFFTGALIHKEPYIDKILQQVCQLSDFHRKHTAYKYQENRRKEGTEESSNSKGIGLALAFFPNDLLSNQNQLSSSTVEITLDQEGQLTIELPANPGHHQLFKYWAGRAVKLLEIEEKNIHFQMLPESTSLMTGPSTMGRNVTVISHLIDQALKGIQSRRFRDPLPLKEKKRFLKNKSRWKDKDFLGMPYQNLTWGAAVVEITLRRETNEVFVENLWLATDPGKVLIPGLILPTFERGLKQAWNWLCPSSEPNRIYLDGGQKGFTFNLDLLSTGKQAKAIDGLIQELFPGAFLQALGQATGKSQHVIPYSLTGFFQEDQ